MAQVKRQVEQTFQDKVLRGMWQLVWLVFYRPTPRSLHFFRRGLLRLFGAHISPGAHPYPGARIYAPWNLIMREDSCLSDFVDCYCVDKIELKENALVSQYSFLCTATHDYTKPSFPTLCAPITIGENAWVAADVFVAPGVTIGTNAVVGARSKVIYDVGENEIVAGDPVRLIKSRLDD